MRILSIGWSAGGTGLVRGWGLGVVLLGAGILFANTPGKRRTP